MNATSWILNSNKRRVIWYGAIMVDGGGKRQDDEILGIRSLAVVYYEYVVYSYEYT